MTRSEPSVCGANKSPCDVQGVAMIPIRIKSFEVTLPFYIVEDLTSPCCYYLARRSSILTSCGLYRKNILLGSSVATRWSSLTMMVELQQYSWYRTPTWPDVGDHCAELTGAVCQSCNQRTDASTRSRVHMAPSILKTALPTPGLPTPPRPDRYYCPVHYWVLAAICGGRSQDCRVLGI